MAPRIGKRSAKNSSSNPLAQRLDSTKIKPSSSSSKDNNKNNNNKRKPYDSNPLLARLSEIGNRKSSGSNKNSNENPLAQRIRNGKFVPPSITSQTQALQNQRLRKSAPSKTPEGKITKKPKSASNNNNNNNIRNGSSKTVLKIRNASNPNFLKIKNLEYGTNIRDLKVVLESIGKTKSIKIKDLESGSALAEVIFVSEATLEKAHTQLNGAIADGRTLRTEITSDSEIFNGAVDSYPNGPRSMRR